jgi:hypothetical protein
MLLPKPPRPKDPRFDPKGTGGRSGWVVGEGGSGGSTAIVATRTVAIHRRRSHRRR